MFVKKLIIIQFLITSIVLSLKTNDLCNLLQNESKGHNNSKKEYQTSCQGKYSFKCGQDKCSIDEKKCKIFEHMNLFLKLQRYKNDFDKYLLLGHTFKIEHINEIKKSQNLTNYD